MSFIVEISTFNFIFMKFCHHVVDGIILSQKGIFFTETYIKVVCIISNFYVIPIFFRQIQFH